MEKYTTTAIKEAINLDKDIKPEDKEAENKKVVISNEAFAICDFIEQLNKKIEHLRISSLRR